MGSKRDKAIKCGICSEVSFQLTDKFDPDVPLTGEMIELTEVKRANGWHGLPGDACHERIRCPRCQSRLVDSLGFISHLVHLDGSHIEEPASAPPPEKTDGDGPKTSRDELMEKIANLRAEKMTWPAIFLKLGHETDYTTSKSMVSGFSRWLATQKSSEVAA